MCYSNSLWKRLVLVYIMAIKLLLLRSVSSMNLTNAYLHHKCHTSQGNYKSGSEYEENINDLSRSFSNYSFPGGFRHTTYGDAPVFVTFIFQCRGDSYGSNCRSCFVTAIAELRRRCQRNKAATIWYDQCFLDINPISRAPMKIDYVNTFSMHNPNNVGGDKASFHKKTSDLLYKLMLKAGQISADGLEFLDYATGEERFGTKKLYAMVQCAKDIGFCADCLKWSIRELSKCCYGKQGARVLGISCNLRYELYPFLRA